MGAAVGTVVGAAVGDTVGAVVGTVVGAGVGGPQDVAYENAVVLVTAPVLSSHVLPGTK